MKIRRITLLLAAVLSCAAQTEFVRSAGPDELIEIDASRPPPDSVPRTIFGTFLEPIGNSIYGGLWAQLLENPSFEDKVWSARQIRRMLDDRPELAVRLGPAAPLGAVEGPGHALRASMGRLRECVAIAPVMGLPAAETGVRQRKRNDPETVLARAEIVLNGSGWEAYPFRLELAEDAVQRLEPADFAIAVKDEARVLIDQASLFPADAIDGMDPDMIELARALKTPVVRFGGNFTSGYHWRDGVGPRDKRVTMLNQSWGMPEYNQFGTDEFLRFCELIGAEPQMALNLGSGTPDEAADWVKYVNGRWGRHSGGLLWELGNELWGPFSDRVSDRVADCGPDARVTMRFWPSEWACHAVRAPGAKVTLAPATRAGAGKLNNGSIRTEPVNTTPALCRDAVSRFF